MTTPLNSQSQGGMPPSSAVAGLNALQEAMGRWSGGAGGGPETDFSRMVAQYRQSESASEPAPPPQSSAPVVAKVGPDPAARALTQRMTDQALQKARLSAQIQGQRSDAASPPSEPTAPSEGNNGSREAAERDVSAKDRTARSANEKGTERKSSPAQDKRTGVDEEAPEVSDDEQTRFSTAQGEGVAWVREINPPAGIDPADPKGMMSWLAALTDGDPAATALSTEATALSAVSPTEEPVLMGQEASGSTGVMSATEGAWAMARLDTLSLVDGTFGQALEGMVATDGTETLELMEGLSPSGARPSPLMGLGPSLVGESLVQRHASATLAPAPGSGQFADAFADQVAVWVGQARADGPMTAELRLNPAEMGPVNIKIAVEGQVARIDFAATALETRQAIESSLAQLSKSLSDVGLNLAGGDVMSQFSQSQGRAQDGAQGQDRRSTTPWAARLSGDESIEPVVARVSGSSGLGGLDLYA